MLLRQISLLLLLLTSHQVAFSQGAVAKPQAPSPEKVLLIRDLLKITGSIDLANQVMSTMMESIKLTTPGIPEEVWSRMIKKLNAEDMIDSLILIYDRHFSIEDLQFTLAFYKSPTGMRVIKELPAVMSESMAVGQDWGQRKAAELLEELKAESRNTKPGNAQ